MIFTLAYLTIGAGVVAFTDKMKGTTAEQATPEAIFSFFFAAFIWPIILGSYIGHSMADNHKQKKELKEAKHQAMLRELEYLEEEMKALK